MSELAQSGVASLPVPKYTIGGRPACGRWVARCGCLDQVHCLLACDSDCNGVPLPRCNAGCAIEVPESGDTVVPTADCPIWGEEAAAWILKGEEQ